MSDTEPPAPESKYRSRTLWLVIGFAIAGTGLLIGDKIESGNWVTVVLALFAGWQARRYGDNKLREGKDGKK